MKQWVCSIGTFKSFPKNFLSPPNIDDTRPKTYIPPRILFGGRADVFHICDAISNSSINQTMPQHHVVPVTIPIVSCDAGDPDLAGRHEDICFSRDLQWPFD